MQLLIYAIVLTRNNQKGLNQALETLSGVNDESLNPVAYEDVTAVAGETDRDNLKKTNALLLRYAEIIETLAADFSLLPMRFGAVVETPQVLEEKLQDNYQQIVQNLDKLSGKYEFGIKVFGNYRKIKQELWQERNSKHDDLPSGENRHEAQYRNYINQKLLQYRQDKLLLNHIDAIIADLKNLLKPYTYRAKFKKFTSAQKLIDGALLLSGENRQDLVQVVETLQNRYGKLKFLLTGPWPPYSFADITIN